MRLFWFRLVLFLVCLAFVPVTFAGTLFVWGSGADIGGKVDALHYAFQAQALAGDVDVISRVASIENTNPLAKAGVMIRETLTDTSKNAMMLITPSSGAMFQRRTKVGAKTVSTKVSGITAPYWVKLSRRGNTFTAFISSDGSQWTTVGSARIVMGAAYVGFAVTSHNNTVLCEASFEQWNIIPQ